MTGATTTDPSFLQRRKAGPFSVRQTTSGYNGNTSYLVWFKPKNGRVSVHAHVTREGAWAEADKLNAGALVKAHADDPRPYDERREEAERYYFTGCRCMVETDPTGGPDKVLTHSSTCPLSPEA